MVILSAIDGRQSIHLIFLTVNDGRYNCGELIIVPKILGLHTIDNYDFVLGRFLRHRVFVHSIRGLRAIESHNLILGRFLSRQVFVIILILGRFLRSRVFVLSYLTRLPKQERPQVRFVRNLVPCSRAFLCLVYPQPVL